MRIRRQSFGKFRASFESLRSPQTSRGLLRQCLTSTVLRTRPSSKRTIPLSFAVALCKAMISCRTRRGSASLIARKVSAAGSNTNLSKQRDGGRRKRSERYNLNGSAIGIVHILAALKERLLERCVPSPPPKRIPPRSLGDRLFPFSRYGSSLSRVRCRTSFLLSNF
jgi:hypothetical protein